MSELSFRCDKYQIMHRDIVIKMSAGCTITDSHNRMTDSKGKKNNNNKICVYSQKYTPITISAPQFDEQSTSRGVVPISKVKPQLQSITSESLSTQGEFNQRKTDEKQFQTINSYEIRRVKEEPFRLNERTIQSISEKIASVKNVYESKIRKIIEDNAKMVNELRILLTQNQRKLAEKDSIIQRLMTINLNRLAAGSAEKLQNNSANLSHVPSLSFLENKIKDLQGMLRLIISNLIDQQQNRAMKIQHIENLLVRHHFMRIASCSYRLQNYIHEIDHKLVGLEETINTVILKKDSSLQTKNSSGIGVKEIQATIMQFGEEISNFKARQFKYQNEAVERLQNILIGLLGRVDQIELLRGSPKLSNSAVFDEDEFFYPPSAKIYETNDEYEHFQSESEEQSTDFPSLNNPSPKKQNKSPNQRNYQSPKSSYR